MAIKIFIDQGHNPGYINAGAVGMGIIESDITYQVGSMLAQLLERDGRFEVRTSRNDPGQVLGYDQNSSLRQRVEMANQWPADYFLSIHVNSNPNPAINGTEVYVYQQYTQAYFLAQHILNGIVRYANTRDNQVRINPGFYVLRRTSMPSNLIELGYLSNSGDAQKLRDHPEQFAYGIYQGMLDYFGFS